MKKLSLLTAILCLSSAAFAQNMYVMTGMLPLNPSVSDVEMTETAPGIYEGTVEHMSKNGYFAFYYGIAGEAEQFYYAKAVTSTFLAISMADDVWPGDNPDNIARAVLTTDADDKASSYISGWPNNNTVCPLQFNVDLNTMSFSLKAIYSDVEETPENMYVWGSTRGPLSSISSYTVMATLNPSADNAEVFTGRLEVPVCGPFDRSDPEFSPGAEDPDGGLYFVMSPNGDAYSVKEIYGGTTAQHVFDLTPDVPASITLQQLGSNLICDNPGIVELSFNFASKVLTATWVEALEEPTDPDPAPEPEPEPDPEPGEITFSISTQDNLPESAYNYVTIQTLDNETGEIEDLPISSNELTYTLLEGFSNFIINSINSDYAVTVSCGDYTDDQLEEMGIVLMQVGEEWENKYPIGSWILTVESDGDADGLTFNVDVAYIGVAEDSPVNVTLNFIGENLNQEAYMCLYMTTEAFSGSFVSQPELDANTITFSAIPTIGINLEPKDGYMIESLTVSPQTDNVNIQGGKYHYSFTILPECPANLVFEVVVASESTTGINGIDAQEGTFSVFNLQGVKVTETDNASVLNSLPKGIYIINGKKVAL